MTKHGVMTAPWSSTDQRSVGSLTQGGYAVQRGVRPQQQQLQQRSVLRDAFPSGVCLHTMQDGRLISDARWGSHIWETAGPEL